MNYTVEWQTETDDQLAAAWLAADDRAAVTAAVTQIDRLLGRDPAAAGESRTGTVRILFESPLTVLYRIDEPNRTVHVFSVGLTRRPS